MRLRVIAEPTLTLRKERKTYDNGKILTVGREIADEARAKEILSTMFDGKPVAEIVNESSEEKQADNTTPNKPVKKAKASKK